ncbi:ABC transporter ATP-binding protein [Methylobacterium sp. BTF04]|uniref:ABC transporter ATP-binding protein n=1 Tax=Methylobacterium sp. BTF04 TaxID=2708300 RepID=UPI0013D4EEC2|nr:ABC transporter ATP-binding protein [Methylobacterium sp. BTF04]NEU14146.1 ABC transporter ATP-binding protein [Methylobacterium sp. BTF04]
MIRSETRSADATPRLELHEVSLRFGATRALDAVSLQVRAGEIIALLGDSGCGKSTLLRAIAGLERPDAGEIRLDGTVVSGGREAVPPEARGVGLMFQDYALFPHLTVAENVRFGLHGQSRAQAKDVATARLEQVGLADRAGDYPGTLSGGESQRVALARALAPGPRILLLDEPFSNLDRRTRDRVRADTLSVLRATATTTLLVTHDPEEAMMLADRIALMRIGRIVQTGSGEDLYQRPVSRFAARFFGALIEIAGHCRDGRVATPFGPIPAPGFAEGTTVLACLRPDAISLAPPGEGLPGRIVDRTFLGASAILEIAVDSLDVPVALAVPCSDTHAPGDTVHLSLSDTGSFVFDAAAD